MKNLKLFWRINEQIRTPEVRVIGTNGKQLGIMKPQEALETARKQKLDLVEIAPRANPPVVKIVELGKFRYQEEKRLRKELVKSKASELKEVRFSPFIAENDYNVRLTRIKGFLSEKNKVKTVVVFKGRQMGSRQFGYDLLKRIFSDLGEGIQTDMEPKFLGRHLVTIISPITKSLRAKKPSNEALGKSK